METILSYSIQNHIRSGAFGKVFRAVKKDTNETIALKMIKNNFESSFLKILNLSFKFIINISENNTITNLEINNLKKLKHKNIVTYYESFVR
jgi:serine/threonine protein kinase